MNKVISQNKRHTFPVDPEFPFEVAQEMTEVNMEQLRRRGRFVSVRSHTTYSKTLKLLVNMQPLAVVSVISSVNISIP